MGIVDIETSNDFEKFMENENVIVKFSADWCGPCKRIHPEYEKLSEKYTNVTFLHVDVDVLENVSKKYDISGLPTFMLFKNGLQVSQFSGASKEKLSNMLSEFSMFE